VTQPPDALPPLRMEWSRLSHDLGRRESQVERLRLTWGSLHIDADRARVQRAAAGEWLVTGSGGIGMRRGAEVIRGKGVVFQSAEGVFTVEDALVAVAPFQLRSDRLHRDPKGVHFDGFTMEAAGGESNELRIQARDARYDAESDRFTLRNSRFVLFGTRIATFPKISFNVGAGGNRSDSRLEFPLIWRQSATSGLATGFKTPLPLGKSTVGRAIWETTTQRGTQWRVDIDRTVFAGASNRRRLFSDAARQPGASAIAGLTALPPSPSPTRVYEDFLTLPMLVVAPRDRWSVSAGATWQARREFVRRDAVVLISRSPQARLNAHFPLGAGFAEAEIERGKVREETPSGTVSDADRSAWVFRAAAPPVAIGSSARLQFQGAVTENRYDRTSAYRVTEGRVALDTTLGERNGIAAGIIARRSYGSTPFLFDLVEAGTEGQWRGQWVIRRVMTAVAWRWDLGQGKVFDREIGIGWRGNLLEPRLTWRTQGRTVSFSIALPSLNL